MKQVLVGGEDRKRGGMGHYVKDLADFWNRVRTKSKLLMPDLDLLFKNNLQVLEIKWFGKSFLQINKQ